MQWRPRQGLPVQHALHGGGGGVPLRVQRQHEVHLERLLLPDVRPHQRPAPPPPPNLVKDPPRRLSKSKPFLRAQPAGEKQCRCLWPQLHKFHTGLNSEKCEVSQKCAKSPPCALPPHCMRHLWRFVGRQANSTPPLRAKPNALVGFRTNMGSSYLAPACMPADWTGGAAHDAHRQLVRDVVLALHVARLLVVSVVWQRPSKNVPR